VTRSAFSLLPLISTGCNVNTSVTLVVASTPVSEETELPPEKSASFECPFCRQPIAVALDGFAFVRTQVIMHLDHCSARPPQTTSAQITDTANNIAGRLRA
jgi:hypothetical protein